MLPPYAHNVILMLREWLMVNAEVRPEAVEKTKDGYGQRRRADATALVMGRATHLSLKLREKELGARHVILCSQAAKSVIVLHREEKASI